jgi:type II secretory pathway component PulF
MPLWISPASSRSRADFFSQLASYIDVGIPLHTALQRLAAHPPHPSLRAPIRRLHGGLLKDQTFCEAAQHLGDWFTRFDLALIRAGETSGRLDDVLKLLAFHHRETARNLSELRSHLTYPALVLVAAIFIVPLPAFLMNGSITSYFLQTFGVIAALIGLVWLGVFLANGRRGESWRAALERATDPVPLLGAARRELALARLSAALQALLNAGVLVSEAWPMAAAASGSPRLRRAVARWPEALAGGATPGDIIVQAPEFPDLFQSSYQTGELSGRLDEQLLWLRRHYEETALSKFRELAIWAPRVAYGCVMAYVVVKIFQLAAGYFATVQSLTE